MVSDEPEILSYAITPFCPTSADGLQSTAKYAVAYHLWLRSARRRIPLGIAVSDHQGNLDVVLRVTAGYSAILLAAMHQIMDVR